MPDKPLHFCRHMGCSELVTGTYCMEHQAQHDREQAAAEARYTRSRGSAASQGYDAQWRAVRLAYLRRHPLCEDCLAEGKTTPAVMVHHIVAIKAGGARLDPRNLRSQCTAHHEEIHGKDRFRRRV